MKVHENYVVTKNINLNLVSLKHSCHLLYDLVNENFNNENTRAFYHDNSGKTSITTNLYNTYNLFLYPYDEFYELFHEIKTLFRECCIDDEQYYLQCWVNFYKQGDFIDWHQHWLPEKNSWHGFFCVDCEPSKTTYMVPGVKDPVDIISEDNMLVLSRSNGDTHRTWPWEDKNRDRITIAFDIVPRHFVQTPGVPIMLNHWIPV